MVYVGLQKVENKCFIVYVGLQKVETIVLWFM